MSEIDEAAGHLLEWELWACADQVMKQHGDGARGFAISRVVDLAAKGDERGVSTWQAISARIDQLAGADGKVQ